MIDSYHNVNDLFKASGTIALHENGKCSSETGGSVT